MNEESSTFRDLVERLRVGDHEAAADLVRRFEPELRRAIRVRLTDPRLRRVVDTEDICQSILAAFFIRARVGEFDLNQPEQLLRLLTAMARNKINDKARRQNALKRDQRRNEAESPLDALEGKDAGPLRVVMGQDLLEQVRKLLDEEECYLADQRALGKGWPEIAEQVGGRPDALRKKLSRALDRVSARLGLEVFEHA
jgi:RNA polymerase sigma-70 factor (ECF subfamily)